MNQNSNDFLKKRITKLEEELEKRKKHQRILEQKIHDLRLKNKILEKNRIRVEKKDYKRRN